MLYFEEWRKNTTLLLEPFSSEQQLQKKKTVTISSFTVAVLVSSVALGQEPRTTTELTAPKPFLGYIPLTKEPATFSVI